MSASVPVLQPHRFAALFEAVTWLGKGAFGRVLLARARATGALFAVKQTPVQTSTEKSATALPEEMGEAAAQTEPPFAHLPRDAAVREAAVMAQLDHPHVLAFQEVGLFILFLKSQD
jgi:serine/threonine protein kinase